MINYQSKALFKFLRNLKPRPGNQRNLAKDVGHKETLHQKTRKLEKMIRNKEKREIGTSMGKRQNLEINRIA